MRQSTSDLDLTDERLDVWLLNKTHLETCVEQECYQEGRLSSDLLRSWTPKQGTTNVPSHKQRDCQSANFSAKAELLLEFGNNAG